MKISYLGWLEHPPPTPLLWLSSQEYEFPSVRRVMELHLVLNCQVQRELLAFRQPHAFHTACCLLPPPHDTSLYSTTLAYAGNNSVLSSHLPQPSRLDKCETGLLKSRKCSLVYFKIFCKQHCL